MPKRNSFRIRLTRAVYMHRAETWYGRLTHAVAKLPPDQRAELDKWESERAHRRNQGTSDWPGFQAILPPAPWLPYPSYVRCSR